MNQAWVETLSLVWVLAAMAGFWVNLYTLKDGKKDRYLAQHHIHKGTRLHVANTNIRRERIRAIVQVLLFVGAIVAINNPPTPPLLEARFILACIFTLMSVFEATNSLVDAKDRKELLVLIDAQQGVTEHDVRNKVYREQAQRAIADMKRQKEER